MRLDIRRREAWARRVKTYLHRGYSITAACDAVGVSRQWWWRHRDEFAHVQPRRPARFGKAS